MPPSIPMTWSGLRSRRETRVKHQTVASAEEDLSVSQEPVVGFGAQGLALPPVVAWSVGILGSAHAYGCRWPTVHVLHPSPGHLARHVGVGAGHCERR